jgi:TetR/AcrR family tetracycline transcriptional repressor
LAAGEIGVTLERTHIVATALDLLDRAGLDGLTMRKLAAALAIQAPSLYHHFPAKAALLDDMADALLAGIALDIDTAADFQHVLRQLAGQLRAALLSRRDGARMFANASRMRHTMLGLDDIVIGALLRAGFDAATAARANFALLHFILGFVLEEQAMAARGADATAATRAMAQGYSNILAVLPEFLDTDQDARFSFGIDLLIRGLGEPVGKKRLPDKGVSSFLDLLQHSVDSKLQG